MDKRGLANRYFSLASIQELTSRIGATDIPEVLDRLNADFDPGKEAERKKRSRTGEKVNISKTPIDVLLATNMISVGVDVPRLGLMVVAGQPKFTSEYIQATSRIGRRFPGLVITVYNWARPRDVSHYERFEHYHSTLYQLVEALSVTPFSPRAMDRGLSALLVSLIRQYDITMNNNGKAGEISGDGLNTQKAISAICKRAELVTNDPSTYEIVHKELVSRLDFWLARAMKLKGGGSKLGYKEQKDNTTLGLLEYPGKKWELYTCLNSLRDVEAPVNLILNDYELSEQSLPTIGEDIEVSDVEP